MSFGFGVGDFLAVATLAWKLSTVLRSAKGASASYHNLISELESTAQSLYYAGQQLETAGLPASPANCVSHGLSRCHANLRSLDIIVKKYAKSMRTPEGKESNWWGVKTGLKKISWEMCEKEGVDEIRTNIRSGVVQIMLILEACGLNAIGRMESKINAMGSMESKVQETYAVVKRVEAAIPQGLGAWHWDHKVIYLDDAIGRSIPILFELCSQWEVFHETLKLAFRGRPGSSWIEAKQFKITTQDNKLVLPASWGCSVKPSTTLLMTMLVPKILKQGEDFPISCPVCYEPYPNYLVAGKSPSQRESAQIQCTKCFISYEYSTPVLLSHDIHQAARTGNININIKPQMTRLYINMISSQQKDIKIFKRLHVVQVESPKLYETYHAGLGSLRQRLQDGGPLACSTSLKTWTLRRHRTHLSTDRVHISASLTIQSQNSTYDRVEEFIRGLGLSEESIHHLDLRSFSMATRLGLRLHGQD